MTQKIKKGDEVIVIAGKDKGKQGKILETFRGKDLVLVEGVHVIRKHQKNKQTRSKGQLIEKPLPIHASNVSLIENGKAVRVGFKFEGEGNDKKKVRIALPSGKTI